MKEKASAENMDNTPMDENMEEALAAGLNTDDSVAGTQNLDGEMYEEELEKLRSERDDIKDKYLRLVAEFENFRKRTAKERLELTQTAGREIIQSLLDVLDDADRATKQMESSNDINQVKEGVSLVLNKFKNTMQQNGVKQMDAKNTEFDPELHEAITEIPSPDEQSQGKVLDVVQNGYYLNDKLIRHAKVVVGK